MSKGLLFRQALMQEQPLQVVGVINAYCARMAERVGFRALYLSGAGVANAAFGLPDLAVTNITEVVEEVRRIVQASPLPLLVDADTGFGHRVNIKRCVQQMIQAGAAGIHLEDQATAKRCGHRPGKALVPVQEMNDRLKAALDARTDPHFVIMARTDAAANEGLSAAIDRANAYAATGADMIFAEALTDLEHYRMFCSQVSVPVLANITEFGKTPLLNREQLQEAGVQMILYPLSAFRAMNQAALNTYQCIRERGTQQDCVATMQTREQLYEFLDYYRYEKEFNDQQQGD